MDLMRFKIKRNMKKKINYQMGRQIIKKIERKTRIKK